MLGCDNLTLEPKEMDSALCCGCFDWIYPRYANSAPDTPSGSSQGIDRSTDFERKRRLEEIQEGRVLAENKKKYRL
jgi:hypothetical protein